MVLPVEPADELLRDPRTGIRPEAADLLRAILQADAEDRGARGHYDLCRAVNALARVGLHLLARVQQLEAGAPVNRVRVTANHPIEVGGMVALPPVKDRTAWRRRGVDPAEGDDAEGPEGDDSTTDLVDGVLRGKPGAWLTAQDVVAELGTAGTLPPGLTAIKAGRILMKRRKSRGWQVQAHPEFSNRRQYRVEAAGAPADEPPHEAPAPPAEPKPPSFVSTVLALLVEDGGAWTAVEIVDLLGRQKVATTSTRVLIALGDLEKREKVKREKLEKPRDKARFEWSAVGGKP